ncbi:hypothetical protein F5Y11DRAFT_364931 [Daldinia sp. FL1419]|nr:hypothetical protein F5Y11DRAFT_364931 [Daldinia sp. FL1419]
MDQRLPPRATIADVFGSGDGVLDDFLTSYHSYKDVEKTKNRTVIDPGDNIRPTAQLHLQIAMGREITVSECTGLHLLWTDGKIYIKPIPKHLLSSTIRGAAIGFLYTYVCLIPRDDDGKAIKWAKWKEFSREFLRDYGPKKVYQSGWRIYSSFLFINLSWIAAAAVFLILVITAMQVGLATDRLKDDGNFQYASYAFTIFAVLSPLCVFGLVVLSALLNRLMAVPWLLTSAIIQEPLSPGTIKILVPLA